MCSSRVTVESTTRSGRTTRSRVGPTLRQCRRRTDLRPGSISGCGVDSDPRRRRPSRLNPNRLYQGTWTSPLTSRVLIEAGAGLTLSHWHQFRLPGVTPEHVMVRDIGISQTWGARQTYWGHPNDSDRYTQRASVSYVTGSHSVKTGFYVEEGVLRPSSLW